jgi:cytochrome P450
VTLLLAGHETTAVALTWTWFLLSQNPDAEAKLHAELEQVLSGVRPSLEDVSALDYTRAVLAEALRLYPPVYMIGRKALDDYRVRNYLVPADASIVMSQFITQRDGRFFANPDRFNPGRWIDAGTRERPRFAYFPFGGGARLCIGEPFAWTEAILVIATLAQRWSLHLEPGYQVELDPRVTLRPKGGLPMVLERR